jgi:arylsulfatase A-like enzyme
MRQLSVAAVAVIVLATPFGAAAEKQPARPNILLVLLDDAGFMDFGAYGSDTATPNIDELGRAGVMLSRYYTHPQCGPSRASLLTGQDQSCSRRW